MSGLQQLDEKLRFRKPVMALVVHPKEGQQGSVRGWNGEGERVAR
jgi:hypothetical protein